MLKFIFVALLVSAASASFLDVISPRGIVSPVQTCGGVGAFTQLRVTGCTAPPCEISPATDYDISVDFIPRDDCSQLGFRLFVVLNDRIHSLVDVLIPGSEVSGGSGYTIDYPHRQDNALQGENFELIVHFYCSTSLQQELCVEVPARMP